MEQNIFLQEYSITTWIDSWKLNGMSEENIENKTKSGSNLGPTYVLPVLSLCIIIKL